MKAILNFVISRPKLSFAAIAIAVGVGAFLTRKLSQQTNSVPIIPVRIPFHRRPAPAMIFVNKFLAKIWGWLKKAGLWMACVLAGDVILHIIKTASGAASEPAVVAVACAALL